jgi:hypothetical protein
MDAVSSVGSSIDAVSQILQMANALTMQQAEKLLRYTVETALSIEAGKGGLIDIQA